LDETSARAVQRLEQNRKARSKYWVFIGED